MDLLPDHEGRLIRLTEERWVHISEHPEMAGMRTAVEETLQSPEIVVQSSGDPEARVYYRFYPRTRSAGNTFARWSR